MRDRLTAEPETMGDLEAEDKYLVCPGTINYFDENGNLVIAPNTPKYRAEKRMWKAQLRSDSDGT